jgi:xylulokinase
LEAQNQLAGQHGVAKAISYPLNGRGERFPFQSSAAEFFCLGGDNSDVDNYRAIMEGVAFTERLGVERLMTLGVAPRRFLATGGGSSSAVWNTIRASVLGHAVHRPESHNSAFGAAMIAAAAITAEQLAHVSDRMVSINATFEPDPAQVPGLEGNYQRFVAELQRRGYLDAEPGAQAGSDTGTNPLDPHSHKKPQR